MLNKKLNSALSDLSEIVMGEKMREIIRNAQNVSPHSETAEKDYEEKVDQAITDIAKLLKEEYEN